MIIIGFKVSGGKMPMIGAQKDSWILTMTPKYKRLRLVFSQTSEDPSFMSVHFLTIHRATFGSGIRGCIGWRFVMTEMRTLLIEFIGRFEYAPVPGKDDIIPATQNIIYPMLKGDEGHNQLPPLVSPAPESYCNKEQLMIR
ncbi:hypothetical protein M422DRAFT_263774 [Sphaerobolus stellatus SS14]|uniref:Cytochrome P450 n=1 Tax=Sphaerobolus stellatus (strain SS14) TaxID=990650 RepID=A0A0C9V9G7_SPHS4|nr:hypothetical protein M422DRAFT_263774 [Sphaerobolus stellatus SS14]